MNIGFWNSQSSAPSSPTMNWSHDGDGTAADIDIKKNGVYVVLPINVGSGTFPVAIGDTIDIHIAKAIGDGSISERLIINENAIQIFNVKTAAPITHTLNIVANVPYTIDGSVEPT